MYFGEEGGEKQNGDGFLVYVTGFSGSNEVLGLLWMVLVFLFASCLHYTYACMYIDLLSPTHGFRRAFYGVGISWICLHTSFFRFPSNFGYPPFQPNRMHASCQGCL
jgi:hypothetical protein